MSIDPAGPKGKQREGAESRPGHRPRRLPLWAGAGLLVSAVVFSLILDACATGYTRPLVSRGLPAEERKDYIIQNGFGIPENVKQAFLDGYVEVGMAREMVFQLYGAPDRTTGGDTNWEYVNSKGNLITGITFKGDKVEKVYGDPRGGSPAGNAGNPTPN
ncbi:MAG: hypothetical protein JF616_17155 [Fibrobacteres bacterium]|jgi:hypothetical protein|nr:hypothetical protein [Fibrobacterota bacterium]